MVESRNINRSDLKLSHSVGDITYRLTTVRLWDDEDLDNCSRFNIQMKLDNEYAEEFINSDFLDGGKWTVIAHSDHNPNGGHNIRNKKDCKNLHIDIHPKTSSKNYNKTYTQICGGKPPNTNEKAIRIIQEYIKENANTILSTYLNWYEKNQ